MKYQYLPKMITASFGLPDKLNEMNRDLPMRDRADGLCLKYESGIGKVMNIKTGDVYAEYKQIANNKYKLIDVK